MDGQVDIWSVGVILYEALFGRAPYASGSLEVWKTPSNKFLTPELQVLRMQIPSVLRIRIWIRIRRIHMFWAFQIH
jgi:serine/threonine protein kinase